jgi:Putative beta-lactamase-inhibitor-like, PepSY-like
VEVEATFSAEGKLLETETDIAVKALPAPILQAMKSNFPGYKIEEAARVVKDGQTYYEFEAERKVNGKETESEFLFDARGKLISQESGSEDDEDEKDDDK